ncbi:hypothetical protein EOA60_03120 [Mesorhizobium sp. M1A.F.Ca.IN.020.06.1.1]|uniref:hypothetical protein n=1 Tax=unclassified Mesorhizobium TaxID=325217 RepID=UPI000FCB90BC|nr:MULTISPECIES: hypothetical protein [unclassified Mesorhizobium]RUU96659.1 hypothetical protein EOA79_26165 [Mesorhizobium sp. M1A.F.Ca.IN.020.03.2.1]RUV88189.1 hypothetical protein EOA51_08220 [Mesorhizobium sp. M1A.F.Ca.IN.020.32.1.1]RUW10605.1 hypothetical protein EOA46_14800 [Mesorhizobium sp. M1A.F.Ca.IN.022.05.2.1]RUW36248.1 hypothetical protein EOA60_03120 [Mesorhizobium sp. M1A.F.Ca.IN.020.06.1.1]RWF82364.1 MAG: hypothetical protein EOQ35_10460 [Mesorhizobium sp.]
MTVRPNLPSIDELYTDAAVRHLIAARNHLQCAVLRFDDAGYEHDPTARSYSYVAGIVAEFNDRPWRHWPPAIPTHIAQGAKEYRRIARRSY